MAYLYKGFCYDFLDLQTAVEAEGEFSNIFYGTEDGYYVWRWDNPGALSPFVTDAIWNQGDDSARVTLEILTELQGTGSPAPVYLDVTHYFYTCVEPESLGLLSEASWDDFYELWGAAAVVLAIAYGVRMAKRVLG